MCNFTGGVEAECAIAVVQCFGDLTELPVNSCHAVKQFEVHIAQPVASAPVPIFHRAVPVLWRDICQKIAGVETLCRLVAQECLIERALLEQSRSTIAEFLEHGQVDPGIRWYRQEVTLVVIKYECGRAIR